ncbi:MAG: ASCH domain-containing protein [Planctomycetes bacterium]|nr:ASCH domain-containing protein [Planctomycetota bacterium]MCH9726063.1 ASCH domain-containing protein [Planctomycetota bacterium]MCH9777215.1 ASCH domain-containing protein [Planctomycetota bacterium]MCH9790498.1 ASCH domain-containing protein [Planctomycetota bacterium]MDF1744907.1 ASCH domain-containing protein [Gimesia sp.]
MKQAIKHPDKSLPALGIRQPWAELILRGIKTIEIRSSQTRIRGPIYIYASKKLAKTPHADIAAEKAGLNVEELPRGVLIGTVEIVDSFPVHRKHTISAGVPAQLLKGKFGWKLANPERLQTLIIPDYLPYGVWFYPYLRKKTGVRKK